MDTATPPVTEDAMVPSRFPASSAILSVDLEVGRFTGRIHAIGAIRSDTGDSFEWSGGDAVKALEDLDAFAGGADCVLGHNIIQHDLPCLAAAAPGLRLLDLPVIDTLRLGPLAFPAHPYHALVKHYKDGALERPTPNDPRLDSALALRVFHEQYDRFLLHAPHLLTVWHRLCTPDPAGRDRALDGMFARFLCGAPRPADDAMPNALAEGLRGRSCRTAAREILRGAASWSNENESWSLAYALAWLSVAGGNSVVPPWVSRQFPETMHIITRLRDRACTDPECRWCREHYDTRRLLQRWFGYDGFRTEPACDDGRPMQQAITETAMAGEHVLGLLPTGTGKSLCYQIPALARYERIGTLTVVISPLVALMSDQVAGLERKGIASAVTVNGMLSMLERQRALDRVRTGDASMLITSPEQMRSPGVVRAIAQRSIGGWVIDEAHCLSRWGHDFRPDYLYVRNIIRKLADHAPPPPLLCLTATAKPDVTHDILEHYAGLGGADMADRREFHLFNGGSERTNLAYHVMPTTDATKFQLIHGALERVLSKQGGGGAIVYCSTKARCEALSVFLKEKGLRADFFHAGLTPERKKDVQTGFISGAIDVIVATNAFGMGVDKPDVRLVVHADIPGSLENYLQEAGRAGRDRDRAYCVLLFSEADVERQFRLSARSRLTRNEINALHRALLRIDTRKRKADPHYRNEVIATVGEILREDEERVFDRDRMTEDTRGRVAIAWLEQAQLLSRTQNEVRVFPSCLRTGSVAQAAKILARSVRDRGWQRALLAVARALIQSDPAEGISTDDLMQVAGLGPAGVLRALHDLEDLGIASNDARITVFVHHATQNSSKNRLRDAEAVEEALIALLRETGPDLGPGEKVPLSLRSLAERLRTAGAPDPIPDRLWRLLHGIAQDQRGEDGKAGSISVTKRSADTVFLSMNHDWDTIETNAAQRRVAAACLVSHLIDHLPRGARGSDLLADTTLGAMERALADDIPLKAARPAAPGPYSDTRLLHRTLLWMHEQDICRLNRGLTVFRPAMTIRLSRPHDRRGFTKADFELLSQHYDDKTRQIHVMAEYARTGLKDIGDARRLVRDYFALEEESFLERWMPGQTRELARQTTAASWRNIVEALGNRTQQHIVTDDREQTHVLVLAGPGSGKTRALVHRLAWLIRVRREDPRSILALAYNRSAAVEIRRRLSGLIGEDARGIDVLTFHSLAMRLTGTSFVGRPEPPGEDEFRQIMSDAVAILEGEGLPPDEADERRERLLAGFRWILVDEYQDIVGEEYRLIAALAGRGSRDDDGKLTLFAVGDDDQSIYAFRGASVEYIRRFEEDYGPKPAYLTENYRSSAHIVDAANAFIAPAADRMKAGRPITVNRDRLDHPPGGRWEALDASVGRGRVQLLPAGRSFFTQARAATDEFLRLRRCDPENWDWRRCAVIAREWRVLEPVQALCESLGIPVQLGRDDSGFFWRVRETQKLIDHLRERRPAVVNADGLIEVLSAFPSNSWTGLLHEAVGDFTVDELGGDKAAEVPVSGFIDWLVDWGRQVRRRQNGLLLVSAHGAKGLEFDHVMVLDGQWDRVTENHGRDSSVDEIRRLYYVAMTRARQTLGLLCLDGRAGLHRELAGMDSVLQRTAAADPETGEADDPRLRRRLHRTMPDEVFLSFAGQRGPDDPVHAALARLSAGMDVEVVRRGKEVLLRGPDGTVVGRMAKRFTIPNGYRIRTARIYAILARGIEQETPEYRERILTPTWEVPLPEFEYEPLA